MIKIEYGHGQISVDKEKHTQTAQWGECFIQINSTVYQDPG